MSPDLVSSVWSGSPARLLTRPRMVPCRNAKRCSVSRVLVTSSSPGKSDRLGRSLRDLVDLVAVPGERDIELETEVLSERTHAGLAAARKRGSRLGRPRSLTPSQVGMAKTMMSNPALSAHQVAEQLGVHRATLYRSINSTW